MKIWALDGDQAVEIIQDIGEQIGFNVDGQVQVCETESSEPPGDRPHAYDISFTPFSTDQSS